MEFNECKLVKAAKEAGLTVSDLRRLINVLIQNREGYKAALVADIAREFGMSNLRQEDFERIAEEGVNKVA